jgi:RimJ/RimL family protein N-acetyltransferase
MAVELTAAAEYGRPALLLRPWAAKDAGALARAHEDPAMRRWLLTHLDGEGAALRWIEAQERAWASHLRCSFAVLEEGGAAPVGHVAVSRAQSGSPSAELGYWTAPAARGRGVAPRAVLAVARWALSAGCVPRLTRIELLHAEGNSASCRVAEKCGFALDQVLDPYPPRFPGPGHLHAYEQPAG